MKRLAVTFFYLGLVGCQVYTPPPPEPHKMLTDEEILKESVDRVAGILKESGVPQAEIDSLSKKSVAYASMPYKQQLQSLITPGDLPSKNMMDLLESSVNDCELQRSFIGTPVLGGDRDRERNRELKQKVSRCSFDSQSVVGNYYYKSFYKKNGIIKSEKAKYDAVNDTYIKWQSYMETLVSAPVGSLADSLAVEVKASIRKTNLIVK
ncbi:hypothetical protein PS862_00233 [Pseudomonas fluorescens]|uniref:Lipoprotein n=1 Tax=Pseudomonas fluorescens TaxID=294 RepID=A0A5E7GDP3_PSEFL|nr:hypothetical protein [Pseudomonas fluorescens]VVO49446.1 hypothetical protein PS862_00233 [Pseudomonas fluorescens]